MAGIAPIEWRRDHCRDQFYASRNYGDISQTYKKPTSNRSGLDWNLTLRQVRKNRLKDFDKIGTSASAPNLSLSELAESRERRAPQTDEHEDGQYHSTTSLVDKERGPTVGRYQNFAGTCHMISKPLRVSSGAAHSIDWQLNLRDGHHQKPVEDWRRYHTRSQRSFDLLAENCSKLNEPYQKSAVTPHDRRMDRREGALPIETVRDDPIGFKRNPGCEGTNVGYWVHMINDRRYGHKARRQIAAESTMREIKGDKHGARICDNRSDGCIVELLGQKKWVGSKSHEPLAQRPPLGDPKLHYLSKMRLIPEPNEENRKLRMAKCPRTDDEISYDHQPPAQLDTRRRKRD